MGQPGDARGDVLVRHAGLGGAGGIINMSYQLNETVHNTQWVTGHFHLIFGGAIVIMYFLIAYELWPQLTGARRCRGGWSTCSCGCGSSACLCRCRGTSWALGMPRRMAYYDFTHPDLAPQAWTVTMSTLGGLLLVISAVLLVFILARAHKASGETAPFTFSATVHAGGHTPAVLNGFALWVAMMIGLTIVNYGFPIAQLAVLKDASVPVIPIGSRW